MVNEHPTRSQAPPEWVAEQLAEYLDAGCNGFVINLYYDRPGLSEREARSSAELNPSER